MQRGRWMDVLWMGVCVCTDLFYGLYLCYNDWEGKQNSPIRLTFAAPAVFVTNPNEERGGWRVGGLGARMGCGWDPEYDRTLILPLTRQSNKSLFGLTSPLPPPIPWSVFDML